LLGKFHAQGSLAGYGAWDPRESDMTERPKQQVLLYTGHNQKEETESINGGSQEG